ncbi:MBOAT-domain-containing protein [Tuber magnatum]|uniref:MBOAT-domain-containing protein n=1 Tax=Tuber magnatum TaxID=42249 RepID=A0A317SJP4_9PEZI|nr:MBOAT-domain-containing protein [Tuber magnatum]
MLRLSTIRSIFSLDTLDSRLTVNSPRSSCPPKNPTTPSLAGAARNGESSRSQKLRKESSPSKWGTPEFWLYIIGVGIAVILMFKTGYDISKESHPNYPKFEHLLSPGWIPGRKVDNSDQQYSNFRDNIPILAAVLSGHFLLRRGFNVLFSRLFPTPPHNSSYRPSHNINRRKYFDILFAVIFLTALHSLSIIKILVILTANWLISFFHPSSIFVPILTWGFSIGVLFANEYFEGYHFRLILPWLIAGEGAGVGYAMDHFLSGGLLPRWEISFNITVLRLISYNMDHYWAAKRLEEADDQKKKLLDPSNISERDRIDTPAAMEDYGFFNYLAYVLYSPLYLAGPIITFNDFAHQQRYPQPTTSPTLVIKYGLRLLSSILTMELVLHYLYVVAISKTGHTHDSWSSDTPFQLSMIGYFNLHIIWLKLLIPWRFFRLWALVDHVDPPENMLRCMSNNYSALAFWRSWHRSFNRWIVRYIYIPFGGASRPIANMVIVFTFVALWHDLSFKLLTWGWLVVLFVIPELVCRKVFSKRRFEGRETAYRYLSGLGAVGNVLMMMGANLVGFAIGVEGVRDLIRGVLGSWEGFGFVALACTALFMAAQIMFEVREGEKRAGIDLRC